MKVQDNGYGNKVNSKHIQLECEGSLTFRISVLDIYYTKDVRQITSLCQQMLTKYHEYTIIHWPDRLLGAYKAMEVSWREPVQEQLRRNGTALDTL